MKAKSGMPPAELQAIAQELCGERGLSALGREIDRNRVTMHRWAQGEAAIGRMESKFLRLLVMMKRKGLNWKKMLLDYEKQPAKPEPKPKPFVANKAMDFL